MIPTILVIPEGLADVARDAIEAFSLDARLLVALPDVLYGRSQEELRASVRACGDRLIAAAFDADVEVAPL